MQNDFKIKSGKLSVHRRDFLRKTGSLTVMSMFGVGFFTSCTSEEDSTPNGNNVNNPPAGAASGIGISGKVTTIDLDKSTVLNTTGGWLLIRESQLLVVNLGNNVFNAMTSICTHSQCDRNWTFASNVFTCTCHGSRFGTDGAVITGPAAQALVNYPISKTNSILTITKD